MTLLDRTSLPPGGWRFYQPETGWSMPDPLSQSWTTAVDRIVQHRRANEALKATATVAQAEVDLEAYTRSRLPANVVVDDGSGSTVRKAAPCAVCGKR